MSDYPETTFLNVDLDVFARTPLEPLALALGSDVIQLYVGRDGRRYRAHFELSKGPRNADAGIVSFARLLKAMPKPARLLWSQATRRDFNIGIQSSFEPRSYEVALKPETLKLVSALNARVVMTIYAADREANR